MSDEKKPFAWYDEDSGAFHVAGIGISYRIRRGVAAIINAAVEHERREAAVKALREAAEAWGPNAGAGPWLRARADKIERGEQ